MSSQDCNIEIISDRHEQFVSKIPQNFFAFFSFLWNFFALKCLCLFVSHQLCFVRNSFTITDILNSMKSLAINHSICNKVVIWTSRTVRSIIVVYFKRIAKIVQQLCTALMYLKNLQKLAIFYYTLLIREQNRKNAKKKTFSENFMVKNITKGNNSTIVLILCGHLKAINSYFLEQSYKTESRIVSSVAKVLEACNIF